MRQLRVFRPTAAIALGALLLAVAPMAAGDDEANQHKKIVVKKIVHDCEGDDCGEAQEHHRVIVIGDDGEMQEIGDGPTSWLHRDRAHAMAWGHHGKGGFLGVSTTELTPELRGHFGVPEDAGVLIARVVDDSAAARAGVQVGDILTAVGGEAVASTGDLLRAISRLEPGSAVDLELWRDGALETLGATLGERQGPRHRAMMMACGDDGADCPEIAGLGQFDCGDEPECDVRVQCGDGGCECTVNGVAAECETLPGFAAPGE